MVVITSGFFIGNNNIQWIIVGTTAADGICGWSLDNSDQWLITESDSDTCLGIGINGHQ